jgi:hypothetical protein
MADRDPYLIGAEVGFLPAGDRRHRCTVPSRPLHSEAGPAGEGGRGVVVHAHSNRRGDLQHSRALGSDSSSAGSTRCIDLRGARRPLKMNESCRPATRITMRSWHAFRGVRATAETQTETELSRRRTDEKRRGFDSEAHFVDGLSAQVTLTAGRRHEGRIEVSRGASGALRRMTRRLPEGPWDLTKIPRIPFWMSQDVFLVGVGGPHVTR